MSGIAGLIRFDGKTPTPADEAGLVAALQHRGPVQRRAAGGGLLLAFGGTVEAPPGDSFVAVADADGYDGLPPAFGSGYRQRGAASFNERNADFAFAGWDANQQAIVCARDPLGVKPLYYAHRPGRFFAFASEIKALLVLGEVPLQPNERQIREYLTWRTDYRPYGEETFYEGIFSLLPGHCLLANDRGVSMQPFWAFGASEVDPEAGAAGYDAQFADRFTAAVGARLGDGSNVGAHLSGGLDSSSVCSVAQAVLSEQRRPPLRTFHVDPGLASTDETGFVRAVVQRHRTEHRTVSPLADALEAALAVNAFFDRPDHFIIPSAFHLSAAHAARAAGCGVVLTGHDGDSVMANAADWLDALGAAGDWSALNGASRAYRARRAESDPDDPTRWERFVRQWVWSDLAQRLRRQPLPLVWEAFQAQRRAFGLPGSTLLTHALGRGWAKLTAPPLPHAVLRDPFVRRVPPRPQRTTADLAEALSAGLPVSASRVLNHTNVVCNEQLNHLGAHLGHRYAFPFFDKTVVELGLAAPLALHFDEGRGRGLVRRGLRHLLPPAVADRTTKTNFAGYGTQAAQALHRATAHRFASPRHSLWDVVDRQRFGRVVRVVFDPRLPASAKTRNNWLLSRVVYLGLWLDSLGGNRP